jgi:hypothetical protein
MHTHAKKKNKATRKPKRNTNTKMYNPMFCMQLQALRLWECQGKGAVPHSALAALTGLTKLEVEGGDTGGVLAQEAQPAWAWLEGVAQLQGLRKLTLRNMDWQPNDGAGMAAASSALANALSQLHSLEEFDTYFHVQDVTAAALASLTRLTSLTTWGPELTGQHPLHGLKQLCIIGDPPCVLQLDRLIGGTTSLQKVQMGNVDDWVSVMVGQHPEGQEQLDVAAMMSVAAALQRCSLGVLQLCSEPNEVSITPFVPALRLLAGRFDKLELNTMTVGPEGTALLAEGLPQLAGLELLLCNMQAGALAPLLLKLTALRRLRLSSCTGLDAVELTACCATAATHGPLTVVVPVGVYGSGLSDAEVTKCAVAVSRVNPRVQIVTDF